MYMRGVVERMPLNGDAQVTLVHVADSPKRFSYCALDPGIAMKQ